EGTGRNLDVVRVTVLDGSGRELAAFGAPSQGAAKAEAGREPPLIVSRTVFTEQAADEDREGTAFALDPGAVTARRQAIGEVRVMVSTARTAGRTRQLKRQIALAGV